MQMLGADTDAMVGVGCKCLGIEQVRKLLAVGAANHSVAGDPRAEKHR